MSTPRTRHQNGSSSQNQSKQSNPLARRITLIIVLSATLCIISAISNKLYPDILPNHMILKIILLTVAVLIITIVKFVINQYKTLKNTYQNLEQSMQQSMMYGGQQVDYVEYPQYGQQTYPQQGYQQGYPQSYQQGYLPPYNQAYNQQPQRRKKGLVFSLIFSIVILAALGYVCIQLFNTAEEVLAKSADIYGYDCIAAKVTEAHSYEYVDPDDEDGGTSTSYGFDAAYEYKGKEYELHSSTSLKRISEGDTVYIYVKTDSPESDRMTSFELFDKIITYFSIASVAEFILITSLPIRLLKKYKKTRRSR